MSDIKDLKRLLCDMHLHSFYSKRYKPNDDVIDMPANEFVDSLQVKGKNVEVFSITDHNYFSKQYYDAIDSYISDKNMKIINGAELDVYVNKNGSEFFQVCIYFSDDVDRQQLETIIDGLYKNNGKPDLPEILTELYKLKCKFIVIPHGNKERGLLDYHFLNGLSEQDKHDFYKYAMYKIYNAFDVTNVFFEKNEKFWAADFYQSTKAYERILNGLSKEKKEDINLHITQFLKDSESIMLTEKEKIILSYMKKYGAYFAYFSFSDWHNKNPYNPSTNNFIFGCLEYAFEAFELATLDPTSRIEYSNDENHIDIPNNIISEVSFDIDGENRTIYFSPGLNAIVGKRGTGKSLLLSVINNLIDQNSESGALKIYKDLKISNIKGKNRGGIDISMGGLSSTTVLTQDQIKEIFENPKKAQDKIAQNFKDIPSLDLTLLNEILQTSLKIKPFNSNYKNLTSDLLSIKNVSTYSFTNYPFLDDVKIKEYYATITSNLKSLITKVFNDGLNADFLLTEKNTIEKEKNILLEIYRLYNQMIAEHNSAKSTNQISLRQSIDNANNSIRFMTENFEIQLNFEKLKYMIDNFKFENPPVEVFQKGKYLFVTYYELPINIKEEIAQKIFNCVTYCNSYDQVEKYIKNEGNHKLKMAYKSLGDDLKKFISSETFKYKNEFYEIEDLYDDADYSVLIKDMNDLNNMVENFKIKNLSKSSLGVKSVAYLDMLFELEDSILILDQPEDNIDNDYISKYLVPNIKLKKKVKQLIFVTHNPSVAVYGDAFNYIYVENDGRIKYTNYLIEKNDDKEKLMNILEGGRGSFSNRNQKFGNVLGDEEYGNT